MEIERQHCAKDEKRGTVEDDLGSFGLRTSAAKSELRRIAY